MPAWTVPGLTRCATPPRRGCSSGCGACPRTAWPAPTPTRSSCWTNWPASGVTVRFTDAPDLAPDDPQATLLTQVQGVIAEYEKAKIAERYRRGKLFRARAGEITTWKAPYGYRRVPAQRGRAGAPGDLRAGGRRGAPDLHRHRGRRARPSARSARRLNADRRAHPRPATGDLGHIDAQPAAAQRGLRRPGLLQPHRDRCPPAGPSRRSRQVPATAEDWIPIDCPADRRRRARSRPPPGSPRQQPSGARAAPNPAPWLLRAWSSAASAESAPTATRCAAATAPGTGTTTAATTTRSRAGGAGPSLPRTQHPRRRPRRLRLRPDPRRAAPSPDPLLAGEQAVTLTPPIPDDELLAAELARLDRKIDAADAERRRLVDLYQAGLIELPELQRRATRGLRPPP